MSIWAQGIAQASKNVILHFSDFEQEEIKICRDLCEEYLWKESHGSKGFPLWQTAFAIGSICSSNTVS